MTKPKTETDELIEMMAVHGYKAYRDGDEGKTFMNIAKGMLSVIRKNVHMVAVPCWCVSGPVDGGIPVAFKECPDCKGHGVVAKEEA